jgi:hypothetical protein
VGGPHRATSDRSPQSDIGALTRLNRFTSSHGRGLFLVALASLVSITAIAEFQSILRADVAFLLYAASRIVDGARLYVDIVEINPPLIVALNVPVVLLARLVGTSEIAVYRLFVLLVMLLSLGATTLMLRPVVRHRGLRRWLVLLVALVLLPMAAEDFGEREHLLLAVILPYIWLVCLRVTGHRPRTFVAVAVGLMAGIGIALKPFFIITWLGLELYRRLRVEGRLAAPAPEATAVLTVLVAYGLSCVLITPQYFGLIGALGSAYGRFLQEPIGRLLVTAPGALLTVWAALTYAALRRWARHPALWDLLLIGSVTLLVAGALQQKDFRYHFYPSFGLATVLLGIAVLDVPPVLAPLTARIYRVAATASLCSVAVMAIGTAVGHSLEKGWGSREDAPFARLVETVRGQAAGGSIMVLSYNIGSTFPLVNYAGVESASRFPQLWILAAEYIDRLRGAAPLRYREPTEMSPAERYLVESVVTDFARHRPLLLLVLRNARDDRVNGLRRFDYLAYFGRDARFARLLGRYEWSETLGEYAIYRRLVRGEARTHPPPTATPGTLDVRVGKSEGFRSIFRRGDFLAALAVFFFSGLWAGAVEFGRGRSRQARPGPADAGKAAGP